MADAYGAALVAAALFSLTRPAAAQTVPTIDTEDAGLGSADVKAGVFHPIVAVDVRNGDFARGGYDDDAASLDRVPVHVQLGFDWALHDDAGGAADLFLVGTTSNGVHAPSAAERAAPRGWYESNNLIGLVARPGGGATLGIAYTVKTSPNGVSDTTHEASLTAALDGDGPVARWRPHAAATVRTRGDGGVFTQAGVAPQIALSEGDDAATIGFPLLLGVGWHGFYGPGTGDVAYASGGIAFRRPFTVAGGHWRFEAEALAVVRDATLRRLGSDDAERDAVVPLATVGLSVAF